MVGPGLGCVPELGTRLGALVAYLVWVPGFGIMVGYLGRAPKLCPKEGSRSWVQRCGTNFGPSFGPKVGLTVWVRKWGPNIGSQHWVPKAISVELNIF